MQTSIPTYTTRNRQLDAALKGLDMAVFQIFRDLGLKTYLGPVLDVSPIDTEDTTYFKLLMDTWGEEWIESRDDLFEHPVFYECARRGQCSNRPTEDDLLATREKIDRVGKPSTLCA